MEYVRNAWYVAGWSGDFDRAPTPLTMLERDIVCYRTEAGEVVALEDRCPHRWLPLSKGRVIGDDLQCGYHGMTFGPDGRCVRVPGQDNLPSSATVHRYPTHEGRGIVWIWTGAPEKADPAGIFDMPEFDEDGWAVHYGDHLQIGSHYLNVAENLCDPAHVSFVHPTTLGNAASEDVPIRVERRGDVVVTSRWIRAAEPVGFFKAFGNFKGMVDRWHYYYLHPPSTSVIDFGSSSELGLDEEDRGKGMRIFALHFLTPVDATSTIDHWMHIRNAATDDPGAGDRMNKLFRIAFAEDKEILEAIQAEEQKSPDRKPVKIAIDRGPNMYRRIVADMVAEERTEPPRA
ncbi:MAG: Rieske 2Fe-2S domain-containing protein [Geminicoccaceae bacterium]